ncbi:NUDIX domain-containing protein [Streptomyces sp. NPDC002644]
MTPTEAAADPAARRPETTATVDTPSHPEPSVPGSVHLRRTVEAYLSHHPGEQEALGELLATPVQPDDATGRTALPGHVNCGAAVLDRDLRVLHIAHRDTGALLVPGGQVEAGDLTLLAAALRKVTEATGIPASAPTLTPQSLKTGQALTPPQDSSRPHALAEARRTGRADHFGNREWMAS